MKQTAYKIVNADENLKIAATVYIPIWLKNAIVINHYNKGELLELGLEAKKGDFKARIAALEATINERELKILELTKKLASSGVL